MGYRSGWLVVILIVAAVLLGVGAVLVWIFCCKKKEKHEHGAIIGQPIVVETTPIAAEKSSEKIVHDTEESREIEKKDSV